MEFFCSELFFTLIFYDCFQFFSRGGPALENMLWRRGVSFRASSILEVVCVKTPKLGKENWSNAQF